MFLRRFFSHNLAQTSYLVGCGRSGEAIVIDPIRHVEPYLQVAAEEGARVTHVTETHIHADYVSGVRELAARTGAKVFLSDEGDAEWKYAFASPDNATLVKQGDQIHIGSVVIDVRHTPGHTPEHLTFLITDTEAASAPIAAATGDFLFVGDVGRPDLLERAARQSGTMESAARTLYGSLQAFANDFPDWLQIWPGHGAGSACGKGISAIPHSTLGYEKRFNWAFQVKSEDEFVQRVLEGQPDPPKYFAEMKRINKTGPRVLRAPAPLVHLEAEALHRILTDGAVVVDTRSAMAFAAGHIPGTINIPANRSFTTWAGSLLPYSQDMYLLVDDRSTTAVDAIVRELSGIGLERVSGYFDDRVIDVWVNDGRPVGTAVHLRPEDLAESLRYGGVLLLDVRSAAEWQERHIHGAQHVPLTELDDRLAELPRDRPIVVHCAGGSRSSIGASLLRARGFPRVMDLSGGLRAWTKAGLRTEI